ncbi:MAG TPA: O-antigen polysaccharide polymerase Wzy [Steroidobacteraceae bacterium]|nr:O-antigen polysaccharide polymerase Wzy [Steroidobacteraceae bacterium]
MSRTALYLLLNVAFALVTVAGAAVHKDVAHPLYVILLFAICSAPVYEAKIVNGPYSLLILWSFDFFLMYGALDFQHLILGIEGATVAPIPSPGIFSRAELVILAGGTVMQFAYRFACRAASKSRPSSAPKNWSERTLVLVGLALWVVSSRLCWEFSVHILTQKSSAAAAAGLASLGGVKVAIFMLARMAQPLSILILAYAQCRYKRPYMLAVVIAVTLYQLFYGFVIDTKTEAIIGGILVLLTNLSVNGRVPKGLLALMVVMIVTSFPILQANRVVRDERGIESDKVAQNIGEAFQEALRATDRVNTGRVRAQSPLERLTTKGSVQLIVDGTGTAHPFQHGYTLSPIVTAFIPRLLWSDKPSIQTGQILNREFHISEDPDTYISPSHLGELYWNFGWAGVIAGMSLIGVLLGVLGAKFNLAEAPTITRLLVMIVTIRLLILASEGELATQYTVWLRSLLAIGLLHWVFARVPWRAGRAADAAQSTPEPEDSPRVLFPNLLR